MEDLASARVAIEGVWPEIDGGRFSVKRLVGELFVVEADIFSDGHDTLGAALVYKDPGGSSWVEAPMRHIGNDRWRGTFRLEENGRYAYSIIAWRDLFASWLDELHKKQAAGMSVSLEIA
jgi:starch synthase (maltosyl-transferring)